MTELPDQPTDRFELVVAFLLGIAAILIAWAAFQGGLLGGDSQKELSKAAVSSDQASQMWTQGYMRQTQDENLFREYAAAQNAGDEELAEFILNSLMEENLTTAIEWWSEQDTEEIPSPFDGGEGNPYTIEEFTTGEELDEQAEKEQAEGERLDDWGDKFDGVGVLLAVSLFLFGVAALLKSPRVKIGLVVLGGAVLLVSMVRLIDLGVYQWTA